MDLNADEMFVPTREDIYHARCRMGYVPPPPDLLWERFRRAVRARFVVIYWLQVTAENAYAPGGAGRKRDREEYERDFPGAASGE